MNITKLAIVGSGGYIGAELNFFLKDKYKITTITSKNKMHKLTNTKNLKKIVLMNDIIIFLSNINSLKENEKYPFKNFKVSIFPLKKICEIINTIKKKKKIIYFSSSSVYGLKRGRVSESSKTSPTCNYDFQKILCEQILINSSSKYLKYIILRLGNIYGPSINKPQSKDRGILGQIIMSAIINNKINIYGTGNYFRNYLYIKDLINLVALIIKKKIFNNEIYNTGSEKSITLKELFFFIAIKISKKIKKKIAVQYKSWPKNYFIIEKRNYKLSCAKLQKDLNWRSSTTIIKGIDNYINYFLKESKCQLRE